MPKPEKKSMEEHPENAKKKKKKHHHTAAAAAASPSDSAFKPSAAVKGLRFGAQFLIKSFPIRRARPSELTRLLALDHAAPFSSTTAFLPTNFTILAHRAWHTLTLGLGTRTSKVLLFVFDTDSMRAAADRIWPPETPLGEANRRLIRAVAGGEMARFKFRKGCLTFYVYAVRRVGSVGFTRGEDLRTILQSVVALRDFLDHTAMLAVPNQPCLSHAPPLSAVYN